MQLRPVEQPALLAGHGGFEGPLHLPEIAAEGSAWQLEGGVERRLVEAAGGRSEAGELGLACLALASDIERPGPGALPGEAQLDKRNGCFYLPRLLADMRLRDPVAVPLLAAHMAALAELGVITRAQGIDGEVIVLNALARGIDHDLDAVIAMDGAIVLTDGGAQLRDVRLGALDAEVEARVIKEHLEARLWVRRNRHLVELGEAAIPGGRLPCGLVEPAIDLWGDGGACRDNSRRLRCFTGPGRHGCHRQKQIEEPLDHRYSPSLWPPARRAATLRAQATGSRSLARSYGRSPR